MMKAVLGVCAALIMTLALSMSFAQQVAWTGPGVAFFNADVPQIIQMSSSAYQNTISTANNYKIPLQPTKSGDALIFGVFYPHGLTISTITNSDSSTWGSPVCTADAGTSNAVTALYVLPNINSGITYFTFSASTNAVEPFQYWVMETNNIATSSPANNSLCTANITGPTLSPGSFTPTTNNNANGGNLIINYVTMCSGTDTQIPTGYTPATNFSMLFSSISNTQGFPHASQWWVQPTQASVTPSMVASGNSADCWNSASMALKLSPGQGASNYSFNLNIAKIIHEEIGFGGNQSFHWPVVGNLRILATTWDVGNVPTVTVSSNDTCGGSSSFTSKGTTGSRVFYQQNCVPNPNLVVTVNTGSSSGQASFRFYDVRNAQSSSYSSEVDLSDSTSCTAGVNNDVPTITPSISAGLTISSLGLGTGPGLSLASGSPTGAVWDLVTYLNETDIDNLENADNQAHVLFSSNATQNWNYDINGATSCYGIASIYQ